METDRSRSFIYIAKKNIDNDHDEMKIVFCLNTILFRKCLILHAMPRIFNEVRSVMIHESV